MTTAHTPYLVLIGAAGRLKLKVGMSVLRAKFKQRWRLEMHEPKEYKLNDQGTLLLVDCVGGPNNMPVDLTGKGKSASEVAAQRQLFELLKEQRKGKTATEITGVNPPTATEVIPEKQPPAGAPVKEETPPAATDATGPGGYIRIPDEELQGLNRMELIELIHTECLGIALPLRVGISNLELIDDIIAARATGATTTETANTATDKEGQ